MTYGLGRAEILSAQANGLTLVILLAFIVYEAIRRLVDPEDPAGIHAHSDFATRDRCRRVVEAAGRQSKLSEWDVARLAVDLAQRAPRGSREQCVAYYLLD